MFPVGSRSRNRGRGFAFNRGAKVPPSFDARLLSDTYNPLITHSRASVRTYFDSTGTLQTAAIDTWPVEYDPSTLRRIGRNISEARTNLALSSQDIRTAGEGNAVAAWNTFNTTVSANSTAAPDGTSTADTLIEDAVTNFHTRTQPITKAASAITYTTSVFIKQAVGSRNVTLQTANNATTSGAQVIVNPSTGAIVQAASVFGSFTSASASVQTCANGWFRVSLTYTTDTDTTLKNILIVTSGTTQSYAGDGASGFYVWGVDVEAGASSTPYIATTTVAVPRSPDLLSITGTNFSGFWNPTQGTFVARYMLVDASNGSNQFVARASDNSYNNSIAMNTNATGFPAIATASGGVFDGVATAAAALTDSVFSTVAGSYSAAGISISKDGAAVVTDSSLTFPTGMTRLDIGGDHAGANHFGSGWISSLAYYSQAMPTLLRSLSA